MIIAIRNTRRNILYTLKYVKKYLIIITSKELIDTYS